MSLITTTLQRLIFPVRTLLWGGNTELKYTNEEPLRSELFSSDQMNHHSKALAGSHKLSEKRFPDRLLPRLADNEKMLHEVRNLLARAVKEDSQITPAGEWLLDNFYLIEEQIRLAKKHLPRLYSEGLPQLSRGPSAGLPRVYDIVLEIISHSDGRIDFESISDFMNAYGTVTHLKLGELWAVPIMLRLALIENLRRVSSRIAVDRIHRNLADYWARQLTETAEHDPKNLVLVLADLARSNPPLERAFVAEFHRQLYGKGPTLAQALTWVEQRLAENGQTSNDLVQAENQKQAADQVSVSNSIGSLKTLSSMDWRGFVESHSIVEQILLEDDIYPLMDFSTRDHYRHQVERIAKNADREEEFVAQIAMNLSKKNKAASAWHDRTTHVGYYLIGKGLGETESAAKMKMPIGAKIRRFCSHMPLLMYLGPIAIITLGVTAAIIYKIKTDTNSYWLLGGIAVLAVLCASQLAITIVNFIATLIVRPSLLPRMDYSIGILERARTLVAVPSLLVSEDDIDMLAEALEVRFLANKDRNLHFGLLTDFTDAPTKETAADKALLEFAKQRIAGLNEKYKAERSDIFFLFHRPRQWNAAEGKWMGYERKRGKLADLNSLLRGGSKDHFSAIIGDQSVLPGIQYVITLDSDTQLPRDSAWKIIAAIDHPLNHAIYDEKKKRVVDGYGILQPRVGVSLPDINSSPYARMNGNEPGLDPYTRAVSDIYQDIFEEGSFIGKGIYNVDIFEKSVNGKFPENRILSHDLLEGCYARSGLLSDVQLYEKYPARYQTDMKRRHRWIRGDWQIAAWIFPFVPGADRHWHRNPLTILSRWKIFDNIRRSLVPIALTIFILLSWTLLPFAGVWTLIVTGMIIVPAILISLWDMLSKPKDVILKHHLILSSRAAGSTAIKILFTAICLPYEAFVSLHAILITSWRMLFSHKHLLEWATMASHEYQSHKKLFSSYLDMWIEPVLAAGMFSWLIYTSPVVLYPAAPILLLWIVAPGITWYVSRPLAQKQVILSGEQKVFLQKVARKTWSFFENFVTANDNWLPPDNYQENPEGVIAHRTSPTNIGMYLLSALSAHDFGFITTNELLERIGNTNDTLKKMERYQGHFYNWYDTQTLTPLRPRYISTVDSGNLAGHLLTLRQGIIGLANQRVLDLKLFAGIRNTWRVLNDVVDKSDSAMLRKFKNIMDEMRTNEPKTPGDFKICLEVLVKAFAEITLSKNNDDESEAIWWKDALGRQIQNALAELKAITPWVFLAPAPVNLKALSFIGYIPTLKELSNLQELIEGELSVHKISGKSEEENKWLDAFKGSVAEAQKCAVERISTIAKLADECNGFSKMELDFLYDVGKDLLSIGYNVDDHHLDPSYYDLLASEARLATFVGIAQGRLPQDSWFALGRLLTNVDGHPILLSWSGSMFEYLMPVLVMPNFHNTLLDQTDKEAVSWQIDYGKQRNVPWGISECGYNITDANQNYQYRAFGAPGLGLKRGLGEDLVIAPYASVMALMVSPEKACENLQLMAQQGFEGKYGFYESIDYTPSRLPPGQSFAIVNSFMAHHQGMSLLSLAYLLLDQPMQKRFEMEPQFQATLLLLQERIPKTSSFYVHTTDIAEIQTTTSEPQVRIIHTPNTPVPAVQLLSNGRYHVMITNAGSGYSRWKNVAITRWREDSTCDNWGYFCYIRDTESGRFWSVAHQPTLKTGKNFEVAFSQGRADLNMVQSSIETHTEIIVSPEDDIEMRRLHITNRSGRSRSIDVTSYAEVVISPLGDDAAHPAFGNLFVQTEILDAQHAILCTRRPRSQDERSPYMFHMIKVHGKEVDHMSYETDRLKFIGRGNSTVNPDAMQSKWPLSGSQGPVLDPIVSVRAALTLEPDESIVLDMIIGIGETRQACQSLIDKYQDKHHKDRIFELAWTHNQVILRQINATEADAQLYSRLAGSVIFMNPALRGEPSILVRNQRGQAGLWPYSISGDVPIVLLKVQDETEIDLVKQVVQAHTYWRLKGLTVDLVIWNENHGGYRQLLQSQINELVASQATNQPGGIFVRGADQISDEDRVLFHTVARVVISGGGGSLADHVNRKVTLKPVMPAFAPLKSHVTSLDTVAPPQDITFFNGLGGFSANGHEYVIYLKEGAMTPAPWINVLANPNFGCVISESGQSYTWSENAHEFRLTPWNNDAVTDSAGEAFYLRDEETGHYWSPAPLPVKNGSEYLIRHGFGYSVFEHNEDGIHSEMWVYVDIEQAIKFTVLKLKNISGRPRKISTTGYVDWVLGDLKPKSVMHIVAEFDADYGAIFARNPYNTEFSGRVAFFDTDETNKTFTCQRTEFLGRNGTLQNPDAMMRSKLSGRAGIGVDPCAATQVTIDMFDGQEREIIFKLGAGKNADEAHELVRKFKGAAKAKEAFEKVKAYWEETTGAVKIETPDKATDILANGWLIYQTMACRLWGRSGFYQSGGAFGFRDQLQDVLALMHTRPELTRQQIILSASRQFKEGDAQHWWHPPVGRGVRTRCSDDFLWLPFVTCKYIESTGDTGILDELIPYLQGRLLNPGEESYYELSSVSDQTSGLYQHCVTAINHAMNFGVNGLPLIGTGDWNDGMDRVGKQGKGESVWLAFFLYDILIRFAPVAIQHNDPDFAAKCRQVADTLKQNIEKNAWDGNWYRRAYFDDGTPLGSATNEECQIDSIAQSWSVLSGAGQPSRTSIAMQSAYERLVHKDDALIQLLTPAFNKSSLEPGYIKGYLPGVRENGGQYTHAAVWLIMAFAKAGDNKRSWELLQLINPVNHGRTDKQIAVYKVEPYVTAGDVYAVTPHTGQGGWTWYTGSAGWMYRVITESILGIKRAGNKLSCEPCIPFEWTSYKIHYRFGKTMYHINITQNTGTGEMTLTLDGVKQEAKSIDLKDDMAEHVVEVIYLKD